MWIVLTEANVLTRLAAAELNAVKNAATEQGQENPLPEIIAAVVREIRGYVAACPNNQLGPEGTIPDELAIAALNRIRYEVTTRLPVASLLTEQRIESNRAAISQFKEAAACRFKIVQPVEVGEQVQPELKGYYGSNDKIEL